MKIIFLNGPPKCGKDFAGEVMRHALYKSKIFKFATVLKIMAHKAFWRGSNCPCLNGPDAFEKVKDIPNPYFYEKTPRETWIAFSETFIKPLYGKDIWGKILLDELQLAIHQDCKFAIITDSGFKEEAQVLIDHFGRDACTLIQIERNDCDFSNDSRSYLDLDVKTIQLHNPGTSKFITLIKETCKEITS